MKKKYMMAACACMSCVLLGSGTYVYDLKHLLQTISAPVLSISILMNTNSLSMEGKSHSGIIPERKGKIL